MSVDINPREVLKYLNDLGYVDISQKQLKEFIRDLKKLIKYDYQRKENIHPEEEQYCDYDCPSAEDIAAQINARQQQEYLSEVFNYLHKTSTASFSAKSKPAAKSDKIITVEILKPRPSRPLLSTGTSDNRLSEEVLQQKTKRPFSSRSGRANDAPLRQKSFTSNKTKQRPIPPSDSSSVKLNENRPTSSRSRNKVYDSGKESRNFRNKSPELTGKQYGGSLQKATNFLEKIKKKSKKPIDSSSSEPEIVKRKPKNVDKSRPKTSFVEKIPKKSKKDVESSSSELEFAKWKPKKANKSRSKTTYTPTVTEKIKVCVKPKKSKKEIDYSSSTEPEILTRKPKDPNKTRPKTPFLEKSKKSKKEIDYCSSNEPEILTRRPKNPNKTRPKTPYSPSVTENSSSENNSPRNRRKSPLTQKRPDFNFRPMTYEPSEFSVPVYPPPNTRKTSLAPRSADLDLRPTTTFIKARGPIRMSKSDPVALYQQYQEEWKKQKLPGEDKRYDLRWAIRERMLGDPELMPRPGTASRKSSRSCGNCR